MDVVVFDGILMFSDDFCIKEQIQVVFLKFSSVKTIIADFDPIPPPLHIFLKVENLFGDYQCLTNHIIRNLQIRFKIRLD